MAERIPVLVVGCPGDLSTKVLEGAKKSSDLVPITMKILGREGIVTLTGESIKGQPIDDAYVQEYLDRTGVLLVRPFEHESIIATAKHMHPNVLVANCADAGGFDVNSRLIENGIPTLFAGTGVPAEQQNKLVELVTARDGLYLPSTNMAAPVVSLMNFFRDYAVAWENSFRTCSLQVRESHQSTKVDPSGTAKTMLRYFKTMGLALNEDALNVKLTPDENRTIQMAPQSYFTCVRNKEFQRERLHVPEEHLSGHGWHNYILEAKNLADLDGQSSIDMLRRKLANNFFVGDNVALQDYTIGIKKHYEMSARSLDGTVYIGTSETATRGLIVTHNVNGRGVYVDGALLALRFLANQVEQKVKAKVFSMSDVLNN